MDLESMTKQLLKQLFAGLLALAALTPSCKRNVEVVEGGVYAFPEVDGGFTVGKVLVADEFAVHLRSYQESFKAVPTTIDTGKLVVFIGHAPLAREGFLKSQPKLITVEEVAESELEGYRMYLQVMNANP